jgi:2-haloacid dehalogenase
MERYEDFWQVTERALVFACRALHLPCAPAMRARLLDAYLHLKAYPEVQRALQALADYPLAILSNGSPQMLQAAVQSAGLASTFAHVISVDAVGIYKPNPRVYQLVLEKERVSPGAIGFVSANAWDVSGAKSFGFWTCWVNRADNPWDELGFAPDVTVHRLTELATILQH